MQTLFLLEGAFTLNELLSKNVLSESAVRDIEYSLALGPQKRKAPLHYVGLLETDTQQIFVLPKYCVLDDKHHARTVVRTLRRFAQSSNVSSIFPDAHLFEHSRPDGLVSKVELASFLLDDFYSNGPLTLRQIRYRPSRNREPDWERTLQRMEPVWTGKNWAYDQWISRHPHTVDQHLIAEIHRSVVAACHARYGDLLGLPALTFPPPRRAQDKSRIVALLKAGMRRVYAARQIQVLQALLLWVSDTPSPVKPVSYFGSCYFHRVWEHCCAYLFRDVKQEPDWVDVMPYPQWWREDTQSTFQALGRFELDALTELPSGAGLLISDAKYYVPSFNGGKALGVPGMESLSKQVHYEQLLQRSMTFRRRYGGDQHRLLNAFVFPQRAAPSSLLWLSGSVMVDQMMERPIACVSLNPLLALDRYLQRQPLSDQELQGISDAISHHCQ